MTVVWINGLWRNLDLFTQVYDRTGSDRQTNENTHGTKLLFVALGVAKSVIDSLMYLSRTTVSSKDPTKRSG